MVRQIIDSLCGGFWVLDPAERIRSMGGRLDGSARPVEFRLPWSTIALLGLVLLAMIVLGVIVFEIWQRYRARRQFEAQAARLGLDDGEKRLLQFVVRHAGLKQAASIFTLEPAFDLGVQRLVESERFSAMSPDMQESTRTLLGELRNKLGFHRPAEDKVSAAMVSLERIAPGTRLEVVRQGSPEYLTATAMGPTGQPNELNMQVDQVVQCQPAESWIVTFSLAGLTWECSAMVIRSDGGQVVIRTPDMARFVNRRRFARVPTQRQAHVARFPYMPDGQMATPQFVPARLVEISGPGLVLQATLPVRMDERVLVVMELRPGKLAQGMGKVRRVTGEGADKTLAVELVGLSTAEVADMARETNLAIRDGALAAAQPVAHTWAAAGA